MRISGAGVFRMPADARLLDGIQRLVPSLDGLVVEDGVDQSAGKRAGLDGIDEADEFLVAAVLLMPACWAIAGAIQCVASPGGGPR